MRTTSRAMVVTLLVLMVAAGPAFSWADSQKALTESTAPPAASGGSANESATREPAGNETATNETAGNESAGNETTIDPSSANATDEANGTSGNASASASP